MIGGLIMPGLLLATPPPPEIFPSDTTAQRVLNEARTAFEAVEDFTADFAYAIVSPRMAHPPFEGKLSYRDGYFNLQVGSQTIFCDNHTQWEYDAEKAEVRIFDHQPNRGIALIFDIFLRGKGATYLGKEQVNGQSCMVIAMQELPTSRYQRAKIWISESLELPVKIVLESDPQTRVIFEFSNIKLNQQLPPECFYFNVEAYPHVLVIDERK